MSKKSSPNFEEDAPTPEAVKRGFKAGAAAFLANRKQPLAQRRKAVAKAIKAAHPPKTAK
jgi:hypothetical protein